MNAYHRLLLHGCSVALFALVNATALAVVEGGTSGPLLVLCGLFAVAAAINAVVWGPDGLTPALLFSLPPLFALATGATGSWLIGPLAAVLLLAAELNIAGWEFRGAATSQLLTRRRVASALQLAAAGSVASVLVMAVTGLGPSIEGTTAVVVSACALMGLAWIIFGSSEAVG